MKKIKNVNENKSEVDAKSKIPSTPDFRKLLPIGTIIEDVFESPDWEQKIIPTDVYDKEKLLLNYTFHG